MPELSRFFGIIIRMFMEAGAPHHRPHFHAVYRDAKAVFAGLLQSGKSPFKIDPLR